MTAATNTTLGEIKLAGDLAGVNNANAPELTSMGITAGTYVFPKISVDTKGRITSLSSTTWADIAGIIPPATTSQKGVIGITTGSNMTITGGLLSVPDATASTAGVVRIGTGLSVSAGLLSVPTATASVAGIVQIGSGITVSAGTISVSTSTLATTGVPGFVKVGTNLTVASGVISAPMATAGTLGVVKVGTGLTVSSGVISANVPVATTSTTGVVKIGSGLSVDGAGNVTFAGTAATASTLGLVKVGTGLSIDGAGSLSLSLPTATAGTVGGVKIGSGVTIDGAGAITYSIPDASAAVKGLVQIGTGINVTGGVISIQPATTSVAGVVKIGNGINVAVDGTISVGSTGFATGSTAGVVKIGSGLSIDSSNGALSLAPASSVVLGGVKPATADTATTSKVSIDVSGILSVPVATNTTFGSVKIPTGSGLNIDGAGSVSVDNSKFAISTVSAPITYASLVSAGTFTLNASNSIGQGARFIVVNAAGSPSATTTTVTFTNSYNGSPLLGVGGCCSLYVVFMNTGASSTFKIPVYNGGGFTATNYTLSGTAGNQYLLVRYDIINFTGSCTVFGGDTKVQWQF